MTPAFKDEIDFLIWADWLFDNYRAEQAELVREDLEDDSSASLWAFEYRLGAVGVAGAVGAVGVGGVGGVGVGVVGVVGVVGAVGVGGVVGVVGVGGADGDVGVGGAADVGV